MNNIDVTISIKQASRWDSASPIFSFSLVMAFSTSTVLAFQSSRRVLSTLWAWSLTAVTASARSARITSYAHFLGAFQFLTWWQTPNIQHTLLDQDKQKIWFAQTGFNEEYFHAPCRTIDFDVFYLLYSLAIYKFSCFNYLICSVTA